MWRLVPSLGRRRMKVFESLLLLTEQQTRWREKRIANIRRTREVIIVMLSGAIE